MHDFTRWLHEMRRQAEATTEADKITKIIQRAGSAGVGERDLRHAIKLERPILDTLLTALLQIKLIAAVERNGERVFVSSCPLQIPT